MLGSGIIVNRVHKQVPNAQCARNCCMQNTVSHTSQFPTARRSELKYSANNCIHSENINNLSWQYKSQFIDDFHYRLVHG